MDDAELNQKRALRDALIAKEDAEQMEDLRTLAELFHLTIEKESKIRGLSTITVKNERGEDVHIGFRNGRKNSDGSAAKACATERIFSVPMTFFGDGIWQYFIDA